jgi:hypothetical protein
MDDRKRFAALVFANQLGLIRKDEVTTAADQRIAELNEVQRETAYQRNDEPKRSKGKVIRLI